MGLVLNIDRWFRKVVAVKTIVTLTIHAIYHEPYIDIGRQHQAACRVIIVFTSFLVRTANANCRDSSVITPPAAHKAIAPMDMITVTEKPVLA